MERVYSLEDWHKPGQSHPRLLQSYPAQWLAGAQAWPVIPPNAFSGWNPHQHGPPWPALPHSNPARSSYITLQPVQPAHFCSASPHQYPYQPCVTCSGPAFPHPNTVQPSVPYPIPTAGVPTGQFLRSDQQSVYPVFQNVNNQLPLPSSILSGHIMTQCPPRSVTPARHLVNQNRHNPLNPLRPTLFNHYNVVSSGQHVSERSGHGADLNRNGHSLSIKQTRQTKQNLSVSCSDQFRGNKQPVSSVPSNQQGQGQVRPTRLPSSLQETPESVLPQNQSQQLLEDRQPLSTNNVDVSRKDKPEQISLENLPCDLLLKILSYLSVTDLVNRVRLTSTLLYEISHDPSLWKNVYVSDVENLKRKSTFLSGLLEQKCYTAGRQDLEEEEVCDTDTCDQSLTTASGIYVETGTVHTDDGRTLQKQQSECRQKTRSCVKDCIRKLKVDNEPQVATICFASDAERTDTRYVGALNNGIKFISGNADCPRFEHLIINNSYFDQYICKLVLANLRLKHLSLSVLNTQRQICFSVEENELIQCYKAFELLQHLKSFRFIFPTSCLHSNTTTNNQLYKHSENLYAAMRIFFQSATGLEDIVVSGVKDSVIQTILENCANLKTLAFSTHSLSSDVFERQAQSSRVSSLQSLTISSSESIVDRKLMKSIAARFPRLKALNFPSTRVALDALSCLLENCLGLESLHLFKAYDMFPRGGHEQIFPASILTRLCYPSRNSLREFSCRADVDDSFVRSLCQHNTALTYVKLGHCPDITDASLASLAQMCPELKQMHLHQEKSRITAQGVLSLIQERPSLISVNVLSKSCKGRLVVKTSKEGESSLGTDSGMTKVSLDAGDVLVTGNAHSVSGMGEGITNSLITMTNKQTVSCESARSRDCSVSNADHLNTTWSRGDEYSRQRGDSRQNNIREVCLGSVPEMTSQDILTLVRVCHGNLVNLSLYGCRALDDFSVKIILRNCSQLVSLTIERETRSTLDTMSTLPAVTDVTLDHIVHYGLNLRQFQAFFYDFTPTALARLFIFSQTLKMVSLTVQTSVDTVLDEVDRLSAELVPDVRVVLHFYTKPHESGLAEKIRIARFKWTGPRFQQNIL